MNITRLKNRIFILIFMAILIFPWIAGGTVRIFNKDAYEKLSVVETEKRKMAQIEWSNLLNTGESISNFVDDRIPFRYTFIAWYNKLNGAIEAKYQVIETAIGSKLYKPVEEPAVTEEVADVGPEEVVEEPAEEVSPYEQFFPLNVNNDVIIGRDGWLFLYGENEFECYQGTNILSEEEKQAYVNKLNELKSICDAQGKELYVIIPPNKSSVYYKYMPTVDIVSSWRRIQQLYEYVNTNCAVPFIYPLGEELVATGRYQIYYKYDSHWNHLGALFGVNTLYDKMGVPYEDPSVYITGPQPAERYDLFEYMGVPESDITYDDFEMTVDYKPEITVEGLNIHSMINRTTSNGAIDKKLCLLGDSYREGMMPYLAKDFTQASFIHRDYMSDAKADIKNADVIVIEAVERFDYEAFSCAQRVINILTE